MTATDTRQRPRLFWESTGRVFAAKTLAAAIMPIQRRLLFNVTAPAPISYLAIADRQQRQATG